MEVLIVKEVTNDNIAYLFGYSLASLFLVGAPRLVGRRKVVGLISRGIHLPSLYAGTGSVVTILGLLLFYSLGP